MYTFYSKIDQIGGPFLLRTGLIKIILGLDYIIEEAIKI